eukprot:11159642-Lingulodinium_polyedra.AAC.1
MRDFGLEGERSFLWWVRALKRAGLTPSSHHQRWITESGTPAGDRAVYEHDVLCSAIEAGCCVDRLNMASLMLAE